MIIQLRDDLHIIHLTVFVFRTFSSVGPVVYSSRFAAALSVPGCATRDMTASKS